MYYLHAFNARGEQLFRDAGGYGQPVTYSHSFAAAQDYRTVVYMTGHTAGVKSGWVNRGDGWKLNRIAYFEILDGPHLLARAVRTDVADDRRPLTRRTKIIILPVTSASDREGDARYSVQSLDGGGYGAFYGIERIGGTAPMLPRSAFAAVREHYAANDTSAAAVAARGAAFLDARAPGREDEINADDSGDPWGTVMDWRFAIADALALLTLDATASLDPETVPAGPEFTPNPYWSGTETRAVKVATVSGAVVGFAVYRASDGAQVDFVEVDSNLGDGQSLFAAGYPCETMANGHEITVAPSEWRRLTDGAQWPATSDKFSNGLAERLYDSDFADDTMGDTDGFGHHSLFADDRAILATDSRGFVGVSVYDTEALARGAWEELGRDYERFCMAAIEDALPTGECEDVFLIFDTARHVNVAPDRDELREHVSQCRICLPHRYALEEF